MSEDLFDAGVEAGRGECEEEIEIYQEALRQASHIVCISSHHSCPAECGYKCPFSKNKVESLDFCKDRTVDMVEDCWSKFFIINAYGEQ